MILSKKYRVREISFSEDDMRVIWKDGVEQSFNLWKLRTDCQCATCVDELTGEKLLDDSTVDPDIYPEKSEYVGNYAIRIYWDDGHSFGIYTFKHLRDFADGVVSE